MSYGYSTVMLGIITVLLFDGKYLLVSDLRYLIFLVHRAI